MSRLLGVSVEKDRANQPTSVVGDLVLKWTILVDKISTIQAKITNEPVPLNEPVLHTVDRLISRGILDSHFRQRLRVANACRNRLIHSVSVPLDEENINQVVTMLTQLIDELNTRYIFNTK